MPLNPGKACYVGLLAAQLEKYREAQKAPLTRPLTLKSLIRACHVGKGQHKAPFCLPRTLHTFSSFTGELLQAPETVLTRNICTGSTSSTRRSLLLCGHASCKHQKRKVEKIQSSSIRAPVILHLKATCGVLRKRYPFEEDCSRCAVCGNGIRHNKYTSNRYSAVARGTIQTQHDECCAD
eukprot:1947336-Amphidinium_carterae.2